MKNYIFLFFAITLLLTGCFKEENELMQSFKNAGDVSIVITVANAIIPTSKLETSKVSFSIDEITGSFERLQIRVYFKGNNTSAILEEFSSKPDGQIEYTVVDLASAVGYPIGDVKAKDEFNIEVLVTSNGVTSASSDAAFTASVIFVDRIAGIYDVHAESYGSPGDWDEFWTVLISPDASDPSIYLMTGIAGSATEIKGVFDVGAGTVTINPGQSIGNAYGYGPTTVVYQNGAENIPLVGELNDADSSMVVDDFGLFLEDYGFEWDVFNTMWDKR